MNQLSSTQIARATFAAAESMGISDRNRIEQLTRQVIERLEQRRTVIRRGNMGPAQPFPGMEDLLPKSFRQQKHLTSESEILALVKEFLDAGEPAQTEEVNSTVKVIKNVDIGRSPVSGIELSENALRVLEKRYLSKDREGNVIEKPEELFRRVARAIASAEANYGSDADVEGWEEEFYRMMTSLEFLPNSPTLMNAGRELGQLSACFVLPVEDSMESIFDAVKNTALIHKSGGGTGFSFSRLRPATDRVGSTGGVASGPVSFMRAFDTATDVIKQGGMRRGANMAILRVDHPDIEKFVRAKDDPTAFTNFNLSVAVTNEFMEAVKTGSDYDLTNPRTGEVEGRRNAREIFDIIVANAWKTGDPGVVFIDRINQDNPTPELGKIESTNPCGEQPLLPYESCNLGSINLAKMIKSTDGKMEIDYPRLAETVGTAVRFLDDVIDVNEFPIPDIAEMTRNSRKIGLGVMGFADLLIQLGLPYDSEEALQVASEVMGFLSEESDRASVKLAEERGVFPVFEGSIYDAPDAPRVRNASRTTIAPTGTLSIIAGCSSGIEPLFALSYVRNILDGAHMVEVDPYFEGVARREGFYSDELMESLATGTQLHTIEGIPDDIKRLFVTAHEVSPEWHVRMQAAFQKHTDNAVSKTVNFPREATKEDIAKVYLMAYEEGLKGITIYRDGSREGQPMSTGASEKVEDVAIAPRRRVKTTTGVTERVNTGCGSLYVTVNWDEQGICEVFATLGKSGGCASAQLEAICRLITLAFRSGVDGGAVIKHLRGIRCPSIAWEEGKSVLSCADAIAGVLEKHVGGAAVEVEDNEASMQDYGLIRNIAGQCPDCGGLLAYEEGCFKCPACGYTKC
ncbi:MAG TPA: vitamin B12-dependent ribonucleotide reductase [Dehalococcoidia bacterium]|nr:vitamin B12-dependent ribonucleotide reductase [Dehalococcoidia bacterium]